MLCPLCQTANAAQSQRCRACGAPLQTRASDAATAPDALPAGTALIGTYAVESVLGQGGFGITYRCHDQMLDRRVAVKEFFPSGCRRHNAEVVAARGLSEADFREARAQFLAEARVLARCRHVGIVGVHAAFEANQTAYMVMELLHGKTLAQLLSGRRGCMEQAEAVAIIERVGEALSFVHEQNLLHRDIKPDNIIVCDDGRVMLIDFGTARETVVNQVQNQTVVVTPGYAPLEQYARQAKRGAFTDVYSLAATLYHLLSSQMPPAASDRAMGVQLRPLRELNPQIGASVAFATECALQMEIAKRPQSVREFLDLLHAPVENVGAPVLPAILRADLLHSDDPEVESLFSSARATATPVEHNEDGEENAQLSPPALPSALTPDFLRAQQLGGDSGAVATPQPVKLAPPSDFSATKPIPPAPTAPTSSYNPASGRIQVKVASNSNSSLALLWWGIAIMCGLFILPGLFGRRNSNSYTSTSSGSYRPGGFGGNSSFSNYPTPQPHLASTSEVSQKQEAANRAWVELAVLAPISAQDLPASAPKNASAPAYPILGDAVEFSPDGTRVAYIDNQAVLRVLRLPGRRVVRSIKLNGKLRPYAMMFAPDNETIAFDLQQKSPQSPGDYIGVMRTEVWSLRTGKQLGGLDVVDAESYRYAWALLNGGQLLMRETKDFKVNKLFYWNPKTKKTTKTPISIPNISVSYHVLSPNGKTLVTGDSSGTLRWMDVKTGKQLHQRSTRLTEGDYQNRFGQNYIGTVNAPLDVLGIDYSLNGAYLASRSEGEINVFGSDANKIGSLSIDGNSAMNFSIAPDGKWLAARGNLPYGPRGMLLWNVKNGQKIRLQAPFESLRDWGFSTDGKQLYGIFAQDEKFQLLTWNVDAKAARKPRLFSSVNRSSFRSSSQILNSATAISPAAQRIAIVTQNSIEVRQKDGGYLAALSASDASATRFSPDGRLLAVGFRYGALQLWNVSSGTLVSQLGNSSAAQFGENVEADDNSARLMAFSADNNLLAYARPNGNSAVIELWNIKGKPRRLAALSQPEAVGALVFSPDGKSLICGGEKGLLRWYDVATRELKNQLKTKEPVFDFAFAARRLVVMSESNATVYDVPANSAKPLQKATVTKLPSAFNQSRDRFTPSAIAPDGKLLATAQGYGDVQIWSLPSGEMLQSVRMSSETSVAPVAALTFSADSTELVAVGQGSGTKETLVATYRRDKSN